MRLQAGGQELSSRPQAVPWQPVGQHQLRWFPANALPLPLSAPPQQVDLKGAIQAGIPFCKAANGVVLSEGPIPTRFVRRIMVSVGTTLAGLLVCAH